MFRHAALIVCSLAIGNVASAQQPHYGAPYGNYSRYAPAATCDCPGGVCRPGYNSGRYVPQTICGPDGCYQVRPQPYANPSYDPRYIPNHHSTYRYPARPASGSNGIFPFNLFGNMFRSRTPPPAYRPPVYAPPVYRPAPRPTYPGYPGSADVPADVGTLR